MNSLSFHTSKPRGRLSSILYLPLWIACCFTTSDGHAYSSCCQAYFSSNLMHSLAITMHNTKNIVRKYLLILYARIKNVQKIKINFNSSVVQFQLHTIVCDVFILFLYFLITQNCRAVYFVFGIHTRQAIDHLNGDYTLMKVIGNLWLIYGRLIFYIFCVFELRFSLSNFIYNFFFC